MTDEFHGAIIEVADKHLLDMIQFKGGKIHRIFKPDEVWSPAYTCFMVSHPDLPEVRRGDLLQHIVPTYKATYSEAGILLEVERIDPPMGKNK